MKTFSAFCSFLFLIFYSCSDNSLYTDLLKTKTERDSLRLIVDSQNKEIGYYKFEKQRLKEQVYYLQKATYSNYDLSTKSGAKRWLLELLRNWVMYEKSSQIKPDFYFEGDTLNIEMKNYSTLAGLPVSYDQQFVFDSMISLSLWTVDDIEYLQVGKLDTDKSLFLILNKRLYEKISSIELHKQIMAACNTIKEDY